MDAFCGVGGNAIQFALTSKRGKQVLYIVHYSVMIFQSFSLKSWVCTLFTSFYFQCFGSNRSFFASDTQYELSVLKNDL